MDKKNKKTWVKNKILANYEKKIFPFKVKKFENFHQFQNEGGQCYPLGEWGTKSQEPIGFYIDYKNSY